MVLILPAKVEEWMQELDVGGKGVVTFMEFEHGARKVFYHKLYMHSLCISQSHARYCIYVCIRSVCARYTSQNHMIYQVRSIYAL